MIGTKLYLSSLIGTLSRRHQSAGIPGWRFLAVRLDCRPTIDERGR